MTDDATLTDFLEPRDEREDDRATERIEPAEGDRMVDGDETSESDERIEPATTTYAWGTYVCASCGSSTDRVWIDRGADGDGGEAGLVCESCKDW